VARDGKSARGSGTADTPAVHLLAAPDQETGGVLAQARVPAETNEHKAALTLLKAMVLQGRVITGDAASGRRDLCRPGVDDGGHYLIKVDDNQPTLVSDIATACGPASSPPGRRQAAEQAAAATTLGKHGGRVARRRRTATTRLDGSRDWPGAAPVARRERTVTAGGEVTVEVQDLITGVPRASGGAATVLDRVRGHGGLEDRRHYVRDVTMGEDGNRTRTGSGPQVLAALRNAAIGHLRMVKSENIAASLRRNAARVRDLLVSLCILKK
jgi:predicted transposase YbfD/YdcC